MKKEPNQSPLSEKTANKHNLRVLFDSGAFIKSETIECVEIDHEVPWGRSKVSIPLSGYRKKASEQNPESQKQIDALFTIGRLIREQKIEAFTSEEIEVELFRGRPRNPDLNAFENCAFDRCSPPLHRSKFKQTSNTREYFAKGGKKDRKKGYSDFTQIGFMRWLANIKNEEANAFIQYSNELNLSEFEIQSLKEVGWFRILAEKLGSEENLPDAFHIWTAHRNKMNVFLTLDNRLVNQVASINNEKRRSIEIHPQVLLPLTLVQSLNIDPDGIPIESDKFYSFIEIENLKENRLGFSESKPNIKNSKKWWQFWK